MRIIGFLADLVFIFDVIINFKAAYYNEDDELVVDRRKIAYHYLKG